MQPGEMIKPGEQPPTPPDNPPSEQPKKEPEQAAPEAAWAFNNAEDVPEDSTTLQTGLPEVSWTASEFIAHDKDVGWYLGLAGVAALLAGLVFLVTEDLVTVVIIGIVAIIFGVFASRQPRVLNYRIDSQGITIAEKHYPYTSFRSFALQEEGAINSIFMIPLKRFIPGLSIYFPPEQEEQIITTLGSYLPHEERPPDAVDRLMRKVRF